MSEYRKVVVEADGGSRGNPGPAGYGAVVREARTGAVLAERKGDLGVATNNVAEYNGLIAGLTAARDLGATDVAVRMDSRLVVEQMAGRWQVKHPSMRPLAAQAASLVREFVSVSFDWIPRERNKHADRLANEAMDSAAGKPARSRPAATSPSAASPRGGAAAPPAWTPAAGPSARLLLARHGSTAHSAELRFSGRNDLPLDEAGRGQAAALARRLSTRGDIAAVVSSPLRRARETAEAVSAACGIAVTESADFAELDFGAWEGMTMAEARERFPRELATWAQAPDSAPPGGEAVAALARRVRRGRDAVLASHPSGTVVVITHVTPIKSLVRLALDAPVSALFRMHLDPASLTIVSYGAGGEARLSLFNDTAHLSS